MLVWNHNGIQLTYWGRNEYLWISIEISLNCCIYTQCHCGTMWSMATDRFAYRLMCWYHSWTAPSRKLHMFSIKFSSSLVISDFMKRFGGQISPSEFSTRYPEIPWCKPRHLTLTLRSQIARFMEPTWGPPGSCRPQIGPMLARWTLLSGMHITQLDPGLQIS